jgi:hypothetical protein
MVASHEDSEAHSEWVYEPAETCLPDGPDDDAFAATDGTKPRTLRAQTIAAKQIGT